MTDRDNAIRQSVLDAYGAAYSTHGRSPSSLLIPKGRQEERFSALTRWMMGADFSVLDFGCGFGDLKPYLERCFKNVRYSGVDLMPEFIRECHDIHGAAADFRHVSSFSEIGDEFDYILVSGTFNTLYHDTPEQHWETVREILVHLFSLARKVLAFDCMTDQVDFKLPNAFHLSPVEAQKFVSERLSRRIAIDQTYMPYEFTTTVFKDVEILRPANVYRDV